jgi:hypothetical protein
MKFPIQIPSTPHFGSLVAIGASVLAIGFGPAVVTAQTTSASAAAEMHNAMVKKTPTNAQLEEEIQDLRKQIVELQQAQKDAADGTPPAKDGMAMGKAGKKKCCAGMPDSGAAKDAVDKPMKKNGMDMGMMGKEHSMAMPAPTTDKPKDPPDPMADH